MRIIATLLVSVAFTGVASAQNPDSSKWMCRNLRTPGTLLTRAKASSVRQRAVRSRRPRSNRNPRLRRRFRRSLRRRLRQRPLPQVHTSPRPAIGREGILRFRQLLRLQSMLASATPPHFPDARPQPTASERPAQAQSCLIVRQAEGHRFRNSMIAGALTGGIGFAVGAASGGAKYEYVDSFHFSNTKLKYDGKELQKLQEAGVHIVTVSKKATGDEIKDARDSCRQ